MIRFHVAFVAALIIHDAAAFARPGKVECKEFEQVICDDNGTALYASCASRSEDEKTCEGCSAMVSWDMSPLADVVEIGRCYTMAELMEGNDDDDEMMSFGSGMYSCVAQEMGGYWPTFEMFMVDGCDGDPIDKSEHSGCDCAGEDDDDNMGKRGRALSVMHRNI